MKWAVFMLTWLFVVELVPAVAAPRKPHSVVLGAVKRVPYSQTGDPSGAAIGEDALKVRALLVDGVLKEWTTGDSHDVTDRSFVVRRVIRLNDALPGDKPGSANKLERWVWQRGPWLLVDRATGHVNALQLPDYDPGVSQVSWFRDYAAYCGLTASGKSLYAVVAQVATRKPVAGQKARGLRCRESSRPGLRPARLATRAAAHHLSSRGQRCGQLRHRSRFGGAGRRLR